MCLCVRAGNFCPSGTGVLTTVNLCGIPSQYCPQGSSAPTPTDSGYHALLSTSGQGYANETQCQPGQYCIGGVAYVCTVGRFGSVFGETNGSCSGECDAGFFCPPQSSSEQQVPCDQPGSYCPQVRLHVDNVTLKHKKCRSGFFFLIAFVCDPECLV